MLTLSVESVYYGHQFILLLGFYLFSVTSLLLIHREMSTTSREHSMLVRIICYLDILQSTFSLFLQERTMPSGMNNCHSFVACALNNMSVPGYSNVHFDVNKLVGIVLTKSHHLSFKGFLLSWVPFALLVIGICLLFMFLFCV